MSVRIDIDYRGQLSCGARHAPSGNELETDAPKDNAGRGLSFSPTDLVATALATCAVTTIAIKAPREDIDFSGATAQVDKHMSTDGPRRIARLDVRISFSGSYPEAQRARLEEIARTCPVARTLSSETQLAYTFEYED